MRAPHPYPGADRKWLIAAIERQEMENRINRSRSKAGHGSIESMRLAQSKAASGEALVDRLRQQLAETQA